MNKSIFTFLLLLFMIGLNAQTSANIRLEGDSDLGKYNVAVHLSFDVASGLGTHNIRLDYDNTLLSNPILLNSAIDASYGATVNEPNPGIASLNGVALVGTPFPIPDAGDALIGVIQFDIIGAVTETVNIEARVGADIPPVEIFDWDGTPFGGQDQLLILTSNDIVEASLPIELSSFDVMKRDERSADVLWTTVSEQNASHFEIERSYDGANFDYLGTVDAAGESKEEINYDFLDRTIELASSQSTVVYYRLKLVDNDGTFEYSDIKTVVFGSDDVEVVVHPNPTADYVQLNTTAEITGVTIFNTNGKVLADNVTYDGQIDLTSLNSGMYKIMIHTSNGDFLKSIVKID